MAIASVSCRGSDPGKLSKVNLRDGLYLIMVAAIALLSAPLQFHITGHCCGGSEHHQNELHTEVLVSETCTP